MPGAPSRWSGGRDTTWTPLDCTRVAEVSFNQLTEGRLRHPAKMLRWRPDKPAEECTYAQLDVAVPVEFAQVFAD